MGNQEEAKIDRVSDEVARLSNKVVALEGNVQGGIKAEDKEFVVLIELLMMQMLKLDEIEAKGELKERRKREVCRIQSILESLDELRERNHATCTALEPCRICLSQGREVCTILLLQRLQQ